MAKKQAIANAIRPGYKQHASKRCVEPDCMGNPKDLLESKEMDCTICKKCWAVHEFRISKETEVQEKLEMEDTKAKKKSEEKEEKIKKKTLLTSEEELEKLIKEADAKEKKKVKKPTGEQTNLF